MTDQQRESDKRLMRCAPCSQKSTLNKKEGNEGKKETKTIREGKELISEGSAVILWQMKDH